ncbi:hypothetical protein [Actinoplanes sp. L3-i22]|uniref:hypothetical protein n=1 Tax=Actinoplanes sp. L3-i22 TaxID=2836373 RepID=UPI001C753E31|nr:hypothetical protein [Actinoplanes sp. L3-i22]BCY13272.1 hypothetical protein L3i22_083600 [Actinoplanes sp. L3-i22]
MDIRSSAPEPPVPVRVTTGPGPVKATPQGPAGAEVLVVAAAAICWFLGIGWLAAPGLPLPPLAVIPVVVVESLVVVIAMSPPLGQRWERRLTRLHPAIARRWRLLAAATIVAGVGSVILAAAYPVFVPYQEIFRGQPQNFDGVYYSDSHGDLTRMSGTDYRHSVEYWEMGFLLVGVLMNSVALAVLAAGARKTARRQAAQAGEG